MMDEEDETSSFETSPLPVTEPMMTKFAFDDHYESHHLSNRLENVSCFLFDLARVNVNFYLFVSPEI